jgi:hypothetical protein
MRKGLGLSALLALGLLSYGAPTVRATDLDVKIDRHKIKEDKEDIAEDRATVSKWQQIVNERRAMRDKAKGNYDGNMNKAGGDHKLTKDAKDRYTSAERSLKRAERKLAKAQENLREDEQELNQAYQELEKDKVD